MFSVHLLLISACLLSGIVYAWIIRARASRLPPGPRKSHWLLSLGLPIPRDPRGPWLSYDLLLKQFGPICSFFMGPVPVILIGKAKVAWDLLEKRGEIYSNRPRLIMAHDILSGKMRGVSMSYGKQWKTWRKIQNIGMSSTASLSYRQYQALESAIVLRSLMETPTRHDTLFQRFAASVVLSIVYGRRAVTLDNNIVKENLASMSAFQKAGIPGQYIVELLPALLWLPRRLQWFRREAEGIKAKDTKLYTSLLRDVKARMDAGTMKDCMSSRCLSSPESHGLTELELAYAVSAAFGAGIDTTVATMEVFLVAIMRFPDAARKAREEIDRVVGRDRLPKFEDMDSLPYIRAFIKEVQRWRPVVPSAVPHCVSRDDEYEQYHIPKGAIIFGNLYTMMQDPELFPDPETFRPERFLDTTDPHFKEFTLPFGFGRRLCPGMHVALQILWAFDISPQRDVHGKETLPDPDAFSTTGLSRIPLHFEFHLRLRSADVGKIIAAEASEADVILREWESGNDI
ncbi:hypothetical protein NM688_g3920 [Phlebia brevispora]|uniref:Uncharacterized protein n=1 Tax=Phlebia brevispora TaxID=194682 RepID=A0ACC1T4K8_9APHY|nr:hypothetical protein NM688_g3920 [Phlebia brevispora]